MNWNGGQRADVRAWTCMYCRNLDSLRWNITNRMTEINTRKELLSVFLKPSGIRYYWRKRASSIGFTAGTDYGTDGPYFIWKPFFFSFLTTNHLDCPEHSWNGRIRWKLCFSNEVGWDAMDPSSLYAYKMGCEASQSLFIKERNWN